jgi:hypothetical protein
MLSEPLTTVTSAAGPHDVRQRAEYYCIGASHFVARLILSLNPFGWW